MTVSIQHAVDVIVDATAVEIAAALAGAAACIISAAGVILGLARCITHFRRKP